MSVSRLLAIEACPRRWALETADYPAIWSNHGYPTKLNRAALSGQAVHLALQRLTTKLTDLGLGTVHDAEFVQAVRELGGFTELLKQSIDAVVSSYRENPRVDLEQVEAWTAARLPELREHLQLLVSRLRVHVCSSAQSQHDRREGPLPVGSHSELGIDDSDLGWRGFVDLLTLSDDECEIVDFKTGQHHPEHEFQIQVYGVLWRRSKALNPSGRPPTKLTLSYLDGDIDVLPLPAANVPEFEEDLRSRTVAVRRAVSETPPEAKPDPEYCCHCPTRQLCEAYWSPTLHAHWNEACASTPAFVDIQVSGLTHRSNSVWEGVVSSGNLTAGTKVLVQVSGKSQSVGTIDSANRVRILGGQLLHTDPGDRPLVAANRATEVFSVPPS